MNEFISSFFILYETLFAINNDDISKILSNSFNPFSLRVLPDSTISTIKSDSDRTGASSMEPYSLRIEHCNPSKR